MSSFTSFEHCQLFAKFSSASRCPAVWYPGKCGQSNNLGVAREEGTGGNRRVYRRKSEGAAKRKCCLNVSESEQWSSIDKKGRREGFTTKVNMVPVLRIKGLVGIWSLCQTDETCTGVGDTKASHFDLERRVYLQESQNIFAFEHHRQKGPPNSSQYRNGGFSLMFSSVQFPAPEKSASFHSPILYIWPFQPATALSLTELLPITVVICSLILTYHCLLCIASPVLRCCSARWPPGCFGVCLQLDMNANRLFKN